MAASRLSAAQKQGLVQRWRAGASSAALADAFGCSPNTVTRVVKGALDPELYEQLKKERGRPVGQLEAPLETTMPEAAPMLEPAFQAPAANGNADDDLDPLNVLDSDPDEICVCISGWSGRGIEV